MTFVSEVQDSQVQLFHYKQHLIFILTSLSCLWTVILFVTTQVTTFRFFFFGRGDLFWQVTWVFNALKWTKPFLYVYSYLNMTVYIIQFHCFYLSEIKQKFVDTTCIYDLKILSWISKPRRFIPYLLGQFIHLFIHEFV